MPSDQIERRLAAILSADVVGYSRLMAEDEQGTIRTVGKYRREVEVLIPKHRGRLVDFTGDNFLAEFPTALEAVQCAVEIQRVIAIQNAEVAVDRQMLFRIGAHLGDIAAEGDRIFGDGVNIAARLQALAEPGGICVSAEVQSLVRNKLDVDLDDLGEREFKNIPELVRVYRLLRDVRKAKTKAVKPSWSRRFRIAAASAAALVLIVAGGIWLSWPAPLGLVLDLAGVGELPSNPPVPDRPSLVVLPFDNLSDDAAQGFFAEGMTEDLTSRLARVPNLFVIARHTASSLKGRSLRIEEVGRELGVRYVLQGGVQQSGSGVRITTQLIDAANEFHLWSETYDRELADIFSLQAEIAEEILLALSVQIREAESQRVRRTPTRDLTAYQAYVQGMTLLRSQRRRDNDSARELFRRAIDLDPGFADAHAALGATFFGEVANHWDTDRKMLDRAEELARRAISIDPRAVDGHTTLALVLLYKGRFPEARASGERAVTLAPGDPVALFTLANVQLADGSILAGLQTLGKVSRLDPNPAPGILGLLAVLNYRVNRVDKAVELWERARAASPDFIGPRLQLTYHYETTGEHDRARELAGEIRRINSTLTVSDAEELSRVLLPNEPTAYLDALRRAGLPDSLHPAPSKLSSRPSIIVLPFDNLSGDPEHER